MITTTPTRTVLGVVNIRGHNCDQYPDYAVAVYAEEGAYIVKTDGPWGFEFIAGPIQNEFEAVKRFTNFMEGMEEIPELAERFLRR